MNDHPLYPCPEAYLEALIYCFTSMESGYFREGAKNVVEYTAYIQNSLDRFGSRCVVFRTWSRIRQATSPVIKLIGTVINQMSKLKRFYPVGLDPGGVGLKTSYN